MLSPGKEEASNEALFESLLFLEEQRQAEEMKRKDLVRLRRKYDGATLLIVASVAGDLKLVELLLELGACPKESDDSGNTALLVACFGSHHFPIVKALVEAGAPVSYSNKEGTSPVAAAAWRGRLQILQYLVTVAAQGGGGVKGGRSLLDCVDSQGRTPRDLAHEWGHSTVVAWIDEQQNA